MVIDLSTLSSINLTNPDNLFFLGVILVLTIIVLLMLIFLVVKTAKAIKKVVVSLFNIELKKPILRRGEAMGISFRVQGNKESSVVSKPKIVESGFVGSSSGAENKSEGEDKKSVKFQRGKSEKEIAESLSRLKPANALGEDTLQSKMPSRTDKPEEDNFKAIKIPTAKNFSTNAVTISKSSDLHGQKPVYEKGKEVVSDKPTQAKIGEEGSIFGGKTGISRRALKHEMIVDPEIKKAARVTRLGLSPVERANLVKDVFSKAYGANISKTDLKGGVRKLNRKMISSKNPEEHARLRKEIKFFKKIGEIK